MPVIPYSKCDMSAGPWDGASEEKKLFASKDNCRMMYAWVDSEADPENKTAYKFPFHFVDVFGMPGQGSVKACQAIIAVLNGARGGAAIPEEDKPKVYEVIARHLKDADVEPAELRSAVIADESVEPSATDRVGELRQGNSGKRLIRSVPKKAIRAVQLDDNQPGVELKILEYNVVDDYGSVWLSGCLNEGLERRLPQLTWGHDWRDVLGRAKKYGDSPSGPILDFYLDDFDAVPRARQAYAQVQSGTIDDCSVGFGYDYLWRPPTEDELKRWPSAKEIIIKADLDEVALVLRGAVPNAKVLTTRSGRSMIIAKETAGQIIVQFAQGNCSLLDALQAIQEASTELSDRDILGQLANNETQGGTEGDVEEIDDEESETFGEDDDQVHVNVDITIPVGSQESKETSVDEDDAELDKELLAALNKVLAI